jgi:protein TonB
MAYIDQDRSREKTISGAVSLVVIGVVGYGLASGLAMKIVRAPTWIIPDREWKLPPPPPEPKPQPKTTTQPKSTADPLPIPIPLPPIPMPKTDPLPLPPIPLPTGGGGGMGDPLPQPQPQPVDHTTRAMPRGDSSRWVTTDDYPPSAVRAGIEGRTSFRLDIGVDGKPTGCSVLASSGSDDLDRTACSRLMSRAHFKPAQDGAGNPVASTYSGGVTWKLPAE